jgi:hypothetical protein
MKITETVLEAQQASTSAMTVASKAGEMDRSRFREECRRRCVTGGTEASRFR